MVCPNFSEFEEIILKLLNDVASDLLGFRLGIDEVKAGNIGVVQGVCADPLKIGVASRWRLQMNGVWTNIYICYAGSKLGVGNCYEQGLNKCCECLDPGVCSGCIDLNCGHNNQFDCNNINDWTYVPSDVWRSDNFWVAGHHEATCGFGFPIGSNWQPPEPPVPNYYEWKEEWNNIQCQLDAFTESALEFTYCNTLTKLEDIKCCLPRPVFLELPCIDFYTVEEGPIIIYRLLFRILLYFPVLAGSVPVNDLGEEIDPLCYYNDYDLSIMGVVGQTIMTDYQLHLQEFIRQFNFVNSQKLNNMVSAYGMVINSQNGAIAPIVADLNIGGLGEKGRGTLGLTVGNRGGFTLQ